MTRKMVLLSLGNAVPVLWTKIYSSVSAGLLHQNPKFELKEKTSTWLEIESVKTVFPRFHLFLNLLLFLLFLNCISLSSFRQLKSETTTSEDIHLNHIIRDMSFKPKVPWITYPLAKIRFCTPKTILIESAQKATLHKYSNLVSWTNIALSYYFVMGWNASNKAIK